MNNLELYRAFYVVGKMGSLTKAAKELYVSQPALSQSIRQLESRLGGRLFVRTSKGMELTPEGEMVFEYVERAMSMIDLAENNFAGMKRLVSGNIRIGASDTLCRHFLLKHIKRFHEMYPDLKIQVTNRTSHEIAALLRSGKVDIGFVNMPVNENDFEITQCMSLHDCFVAKPGYIDSNKLGIADITKYPMIMIENISNTRQFLDRFMAARGVRLKPDIELGSFDLVIEFVNAGLGIACLTKEFIREELDSEKLVELDVDFIMPARAIGMISLRNVPLTFAARRFLEIIEEQKKQEQSE